MVVLKLGILNPRKIVFYLLNFLNSIVPKSDNKLFFYDSTLRKDNLWALYRKLINENYNANYKIIYFTKRVSETGEINNENVIMTSSNIAGIYHQLTSKYVFWGFGAYRFMCKPKKGQRIINLWHGSPLKTIGYLAGQNPWYKYKDSFSNIICASHYFKEILSKCFEFEDDQGVILGAPRNDYLFSDKECLKLLQINKQNYSKVVLWMPTFRKSESNNYMDSKIDFPVLSEENIQPLNNFLVKMGILIIIKPHPLQESLPLFKKNTSNIINLNNNYLESKSVELYELLGQVDALLTDYSSVYFDFLLTQKPIGFVFDDLNDYSENRGFVVDNPLDIMPGAKIYDYQGIIEFLNNLMDGKDTFKEARREINRIANFYQDDNNSKRLLDFLGIKLDH